MHPILRIQFFLQLSVQIFRKFKSIGTEFLLEHLNDFRDFSSGGMRKLFHQKVEEFEQQLVELVVAGNTFQETGFLFVFRDFVRRVIVLHRITPEDLACSFDSEESGPEIMRQPSKEFVLTELLNRVSESFGTEFIRRSFL